ncbi:MAG: ABC transporter ATP-binding protein [Firmicutes bacterium]|nr:ABC transporter ATP-binding protein [Bacillota bacterium]
MTSLEIKNLHSGYNDTIIIREINLAVEQGEILCILGRNGMGKSTLLKTVMGVIRAKEGEINYRGISIKGLQPFEIARRGIGYAPQEAAIFANLTVRENLAIGFPQKTFTREAKKALGYFPHLKERLSQKAGTLSGGETKMLIACRALMGNHDLILFDEVTEGVQPSIVSDIQEALYNVNKKNNTTIIIVEQNVTFAKEIAQNYVIMSQGSIVEKGSGKEWDMDRIEKYIVI